MDRGSPAWRKGIRAGEQLVSINGNAIGDVLDYRFYMTDTRLRLELLREGVSRQVTVVKEEYDDLGLEFETYLMDRQHHCKNKCIFCFVDQLPPGLRESLYFKDDDSRMSFFFGSYVTLTNMSEEEVRRIIKMRISPINISVHTTNPELRVRMLANPNAAKSLDYIPLLTDAGIQVNTQLVLCPGINDGEELRRSLYDLEKYYPNLQSIALVPVGLTKHRAGLYPPRPMTAEEAGANLDIAER
ncbi:MAG: PDZ domain-containing protein, partial [Angelakisella sp.]